MFKIAKKLIDIILNLKLRTKVILFILFIIVPIAVLAIFLFNYLTQTSIGVEERSLDEIISLIKQGLLDGVSAKAQIYDLTFKNMIIDIGALKDDIIGVGFKGDLLTNYYYKHQIISDVYFIDDSGLISIVPSSETLSQKKVDLTQIKEFSFLTSETENKFVGRWLGPYNDFKKQKEIISYILPVWKGNEFKGIVAFDLSVSSLFSEIVRVDPSRSSYVFIIKSNGEFISSSEKIYDDLKIDKAKSSNIFDSQIIKDQGLSNLFTSAGGEEGTFTIEGKAGESQKNAAFANIPSFGGKLFVISPLDEIIQLQKEKVQAIQQVVRTIGMSGLIYMILLAVFISFASFLFLKKGLLGPIALLEKGIKNIESGNLDSKIEIKSKDEIGQLADSFNSMTTKLAVSLRELHEEEARLVASINSLPLGFAIVDTKGVFAIANPTLSNLFSSGSKTLSFSDISALFPDKIGDKKFNLDVERERVLRDKKTIEIKEIPLGDKFIHVFLSPIIFAHKGREEVIGIVFLVEDITEQKRLEEAKNSFVAITAHQLRTPLTVVRGNAELLLGMFPKRITDPQIKAMIEAIERSSVRLLGIVNDFLDLTAIEEHRIQIKNERFNFVDATNEVVNDFKAKAAEKSLSLQLSLPVELLPEIIADRNLAKEIIVNILSNAIQYTEKGGITLSLAKDDGFVELSIKDTGIGIKASEQKLLFQKFQTVGGRFMHSREYGSGMGLYISKLLAELMNGTVNLKESSPGVGSTFVISLPIYVG